jgi:hypothetical protein
MFLAVFDIKKSKYPGPVGQLIKDPAGSESGTLIVTGIKIRFYSVHVQALTSRVQLLAQIRKKIYLIDGFISIPYQFGKRQ